VINAVICGSCGAYCSFQKGRGEGAEGFWLAFFLGPFGVIAAACLPDLRCAAAAASRPAPEAAGASHVDPGMRIMRPAPEPEPAAVEPVGASRRAAESQRRVDADRAAEKAIAEAMARKAARRKEREQ
jgi:hypothetical protein